MQQITMDENSLHWLGLFVNLRANYGFYRIISCSRSSITPCYASCNTTDPTRFGASIGAGPYFYWGKSAKTVNVFWPKHERAYGGQLRACFSFMNYLFLEGIGTYDSQFKWNGQIKLALCIPFDVIFYNDCSKNPFGLQRSVKRNKIIVVDSINRFSTDPQIFDPENQPR